MTGRLESAILPVDGEQGEGVLRLRSLGRVSRKQMAVGDDGDLSVGRDVDVRGGGGPVETGRQG